MEKTIAAFTNAIKAIKSFPWPSIVVLLIASNVYTLRWLRGQIDKELQDKDKIIELKEKIIQVQDQRNAEKDRTLQILYNRPKQQSLPNEDQ